MEAGCASRESYLERSAAVEGKGAQNIDATQLLATLTIATFAGLCLVLLAQRRMRLDAEWERRNPRARFKYCGMTILFYEHSHGNQIEYLDPSGYCYLWYPGNSIVVVGRWRYDDSNIYFKYGINTYNPVTGVIGGGWEGCPIAAWSFSIVEVVIGDTLELKKGIPFVLKREPRIRFIHGLKSPE